MSVSEDIMTIATEAGHPVFDGYAHTGATLPYTVHRPLLVTPEGVAISGDALGWDFQHSLYACAGSAEASFNLALMLMQGLQGRYVGGTTLSVSMGYSGAQIEGHYESQLTVQLNQGGIS
jgi:hypothetical protein